MENINLNELRNIAYKTACEHGFHDKRLSEEHLPLSCHFRAYGSCGSGKKGKIRKEM